MKQLGPLDATYIVVDGKKGDEELHSYMGVSLNGGTSISHPKCWSFLVGKPIVVGENHHFRSCHHMGSRREHDIRIPIKQPG